MKMYRSKMESNPEKERKFIFSLYVNINISSYPQRQSAIDAYDHKCLAKKPDCKMKITTMCSVMTTGQLVQHMLKRTMSKISKKVVTSSRAFRKKSQREGKGFGNWDSRIGIELEQTRWRKSGLIPSKSFSVSILFLGQFVG